MGTTVQYRRAAISSASTKIVMTITQEGHAKKGQSYEIGVWEGIKADTAAKRSVLKGSGVWPVAHTVSMSEDPKVTIDGVDKSECDKIIAFLGQGAANVLMTLEIIMKVPGYDARTDSIEGVCLENLGSFDIKREGATISLEGGFTRLLENGVDVLDLEAQA